MKIENKILESVTNSNKKARQFIRHDHINKNKAIAFQWKKISEQRIEEHKTKFPKKLEQIRALKNKMFLQNLKEVRHLFYT
jgi:hypothetical protein